MQPETKVKKRSFLVQMKHVVFNVDTHKLHPSSPLSKLPVRVQRNWALHNREPDYSNCIGIKCNSEHNQVFGRNVVICLWAYNSFPRMGSIINERSDKSSKLL